MIILQLVNEFILEVLEDSKDEMSHEEIQSVLAHDNPGGANPLKSLEGIIDRGYSTDAVKLKRGAWFD